MYGNNRSENGKNCSEDKMSTIALTEAKSWAQRLLDREWQGRGDKEYLARYRLSVRTGVSESYLYRLQYKTREMKDVAGSVYRALKLEYDRVCQHNEEAADRYRAERLGTVNHETTGEKHPAQGVGMATAESQKGDSPQPRRK